MLRDRYSDTHRYVYMEEVYSGTVSTGRKVSIIDALAMHCYASDVEHLTAFEIKVNRSDWLSELRNPEKNSAWHEIAGEFVYVAPDGVIQKDEIPDGCGWLRARPGSDGVPALRMAVKPRRMKQVDIGPTALAAMLRSAAYTGSRSRSTWNIRYMESPAATSVEPDPVNAGEKVLPVAVERLLREASPVALRVAADLEARSEMGVEKYGVPLMTENSRVGMYDLYQEALDAVNYSTLLTMKNGSSSEYEQLQRSAVALAMRTRRMIDKGLG
jgi:hypothetical protein